MEVFFITAPLLYTNNTENYTFVQGNLLWKTCGYLYDCAKVVQKTAKEAMILHDLFYRILGVFT